MTSHQRLAVVLGAPSRRASLACNVDDVNRSVDMASGDDRLGVAAVLAVDGRLLRYNGSDAFLSSQSSTSMSCDVDADDELSGSAWATVNPYALKRLGGGAVVAAASVARPACASTRSPRATQSASCVTAVDRSGGGKEGAPPSGVRLTIDTALDDDDDQRFADAGVRSSLTAVARGGGQSGASPSSSLPWTPSPCSGSGFVEGGASTRASGRAGSAAHNGASGRGASGGAVAANPLVASFDAGSDGNNELFKRGSVANTRFAFRLNLPAVDGRTSPSDGEGDSWCRGARPDSGRAHRRERFELLQARCDGGSGVGSATAAPPARGVVGGGATSVAVTPIAMGGKAAAGESHYFSVPAPRYTSAGRKPDGGERGGDGGTVPAAAAPSVGERGHRDRPPMSGAPRGTSVPGGSPSHVGGGGSGGSGRPGPVPRVRLAPLQHHVNLPAPSPIAAVSLAGASGTAAAAVPAMGALLPSSAVVSGGGGGGAWQSPMLALPPLGLDCGVGEAPLSLSATSRSTTTFRFPLGEPRRAVRAFTEGTHFHPVSAVHDGGVLLGSELLPGGGGGSAGAQNCDDADLPLSCVASRVGSARVARGDGVSGRAAGALHTHDGADDDDDVGEGSCGSDWFRSALQERRRGGRDDDGAAGAGDSGGRHVSRNGRGGAVSVATANSVGALDGSGSWSHVERDDGSSSGRGDSKCRDDGDSGGSVNPHDGCASDSDSFDDSDGGGYGVGNSYRPGLGNSFDSGL